MEVSNEDVRFEVVSSDGREDGSADAVRNVVWIIVPFPSRDKLFQFR